MNVFEIRNRNLLWLMRANKAAGRKDKDFGQQAGGIDPSFLSQLKGGKRMGDDVASDINKALGKPDGWMDNPQWDGAEVPTLDQPDNLVRVVEALAHSQTYLSQALAATIPTAARELLGALDNTLPPELRAIGYIQTLRAAIVTQLAHSDRAALPGVSQKAPAAPRRKRR
jgi:hypothetical protein